MSDKYYKRAKIFISIPVILLVIACIWCFLASFVMFGKRPELLLASFGISSLLISVPGMILAFCGMESAKKAEKEQTATKKIICIGAAELILFTVFLIIDAGFLIWL